MTNGLGGYASGTLAGVNTRRYHGLLVAALPNPIGRLVMLNHLGERVCVAGGTADGARGRRDALLAVWIRRRASSCRFSSRGGPARLGVRVGGRSDREAVCHATQAEHGVRSLLPNEGRRAGSARTAPGAALPLVRSAREQARSRRAIRCRSPAGYYVFDVRRSDSCRHCVCASTAQARHSCTKSA